MSMVISLTKIKLILAQNGGIFNLLDKLSFGII